RNEAAAPPDRNIDRAADQRCQEDEQRRPAGNAELRERELDHIGEQNADQQHEQNGGDCRRHAPSIRPQALRLPELRLTTDPRGTAPCARSRSMRRAVPVCAICLAQTPTARRSCACGWRASATPISN